MASPVTTPAPVHQNALDRAVLIEYDHQRAVQHSAIIAGMDAAIRQQVADLRVNQAAKAMTELLAHDVDPGDNPYQVPTRPEMIRHVAIELHVTPEERALLGWPPIHAPRGEGA